MKTVKLITKALAAKLPAIYTHDGKKPHEVPVIFKVFNPYGTGTWYITEGDVETGEMFGLCDLGSPELGYVNLKELEQIRVKFGGYEFPLERDIRYSGTLLDAMKDAGYPYYNEEAA